MFVGVPQVCSLLLIEKTLKVPDAANTCVCDFIYVCSLMAPHQITSSLLFGTTHVGRVKQMHKNLQGWSFQLKKDGRKSNGRFYKRLDS